jgi:hypothetical protein
MFKITQKKGFNLTFENGYKISVQFGPGNYCTQQNAKFDEPEKTDYWKSGSAEIAVLDTKDKFMNLGSDDVKGWCSANEVADYIEAVSSAKNINQLRANLSHLNN